MGMKDDVLVQYKESAANSSSPGDKSASSTSKVDVPEVFRNCIETYMKVQFVQRFHVCKVCGFKVTQDDEGGSEILAAHVMEHSLKELYDSGSW